MAEVFLLISKPQQVPEHLQVKCAVCESARIVKTADRNFSGPLELQSALQTVGVAENVSQAPHQVFRTGLPTFIAVSVDAARRLGVLE